MRKFILPRLLNETVGRSRRYGATIQFLRGFGHDLATAAQLGMSRASDSDLLIVARNDQRILVTRDRDFGSLVFIEVLSSGVIYLRMTSSTINVVHTELGRVLAQYSEAVLLKSFVVVEPGRHRLRRFVV